MYTWFQGFCFLFFIDNNNIMRIVYNNYYAVTLLNNIIMKSVKLGTYLNKVRKRKDRFMLLDPGIIYIYNVDDLVDDIGGRRGVKYWVRTKYIKKLVALKRAFLNK